jgi:hypothetical protein
LVEFYHRGTATTGTDLEIAEKDGWNGCAFLPAEVFTAAAFYGSYHVFRVLIR